MSMVNKALKGYTQLPLWLTSAMAPVFYVMPQNLRYGGIYRSETRELTRVNRLTSQQLQAERAESLHRLIQYAYEHVPYYHDLFAKTGITPSDIRKLEHLSKIPFLEKADIIRHRERMVSDEFDKGSLIYLTTSGSTGEPTGFYVQKESPMREWVYCLHMLGQFGYRPTSSKLVLRGKVFWAQREKGRSWQWDAFKRELSVNIFDMTPENMEEYCQEIEKHKPEFAYGYMSAMYTLCKYIKTRPGGLKHHFKGFMGISETIMPEQRTFVEEVIKARVFSFYGMSERVIIGAECLHSTEYHIEPLYGVAELVDQAGNVITKPGVEGELVGTSLLNYAMPLIRYKTGDISCWSERPECGCGSAMERLAGVSGRWKHDMMINKDGALVSMTAINMHSDVFERVFRYQLYQEEAGRVMIRAVVRETFTEADRIKLLDQFREKTNDKIDYEFHKVDHIMPKPNGKCALVDQRLDVSQYL